MTQSLPTDIPDTKTKRHPAEHQDRWQRELGATEVSPGVAKATVGIFALIILLPVVVHLVVDLRAGSTPAVVRAWGAFAEVLAKVPHISERDHGHQGIESDLKNSDPLRARVQPQAQALITTWGGYGNNKAVMGENGWLFYEPGLQYLLGRGLLDPIRLDKRRHQLIAAGGHEDAVQPDPRPAIIDFHQRLQEAGIDLVVVPIPDKAQLQPGQLSGRFDASGPQPVVHNVDYAAVIADLRAAGVQVADFTPATVTAGDQRFLVQDTHWTPEWMGTVADSLSARLRPALGDAAGSRDWRREPATISRVGDLVDMLSLPDAQGIFQPQQVTIDRVLDAESGDSFTGSSGAPLLLMGDSFANIFQEPAMGWGSSAGLAAQLAARLQTEVDIIARNGSGATATRAELARRPQPLAGTRAVVWAFAARELMHADWRVIPIDIADEPADTIAQQDGEMESGANVSVRLELAPPTIDPATTPYADALVYLTAEVIEVHADFASDPVGERVLLAVPLVRERQRQPPSQWQAGQTLRLQLQRAIPAHAQTWEVIDETDEYTLAPVWVAGTDGENQ